MYMHLIWEIRFKLAIKCEKISDLPCLFGNSQTRKVVKYKTLDFNNESYSRKNDKLLSPNKIGNSISVQTYIVLFEAPTHDIQTEECT